MRPATGKIIEALTSRGHKVTRSGSGWTTRCVAHEDTNASLSIGEGREGVVLKCHAGCDNKAIVAALGLKLSDLFDESKSQRSQIVKCYDYPDENGELLSQTVRFEPKDFRQRRPDGKGGFIWGLGDCRRVLYNLPAVVKATNVFLVEGEKDADNLTALGLVATTAPMGASKSGQAPKWREEYSKLLAGKHVTILPDNDESGEAHALAAAASLQQYAASVAILHLPGLPPKGDVSDWIAAGGTREQLEELVNRDETHAIGPTVSIPAAAKTTEQGLTSSGDEFITIGWVAEKFLRDHPDVRYVPQAGYWLIWDGTRWKPDELGLVYYRVAQTLRTLRANAADERTEERRKKMFALGTQLDCADGYSKVIKTAATRPGISVSMADLDTDPWLLNCLNGTLDLRTGQLTSHDPAQMITKLAPVKYDPDAKHPTWEKFINDVLPDEDLQRYVQRAIGYSVTGLMPDHVFIVHGPTKSGKSTIAESMRAMLGDYAATADFETFVARRNSGGPRNDIARLAGKRVVLSIEVDEGAKLAQALVKTMTGGDNMTARFLYKESFEFSPTFTVWICCNHAPQAPHDDDAVWERIRMLPFDKTVPEGKRDPQLKQTLRTDPAARSAILAWVVRGCREWQKDGLKSPSSVVRATHDYRASQDELGDFMQDCCDLRDKNVFTTSKAIREAYTSYCKEAGIRSPMDIGRFWDRLSALGCERDKRQDGRGWRGIQLVGAYATRENAAECSF